MARNCEVMSRKIIIAIGAAGLIVTLSNWTEAVARGAGAPHGQANWHSTSSHYAGHNNNFGSGADRHHAHSGEAKNSSSHEGRWEKSSSFGDNRHNSADHDGEWHRSSSFGDSRQTSADHDGEWHKTSSGFHREWQADGD